MKNINHLSREEQQNFMQCPHCKEYIDLHNLKNAVAYIIGKCLPKKPDVLYIKIIIAQSFEEIIGGNVINLN